MEDRLQAECEDPDLAAMIAASASGDERAITRATATYVGEMEPTITDALDAIDRSVVHRR